VRKAQPGALEFDGDCGTHGCVVGVPSGKTANQSAGKRGGRPAGGQQSISPPPEADGFHDFERADVHVLLVRADQRTLEQEVVDGELAHVELEVRKGNQGDQNYDLPSSVDLNQDQAVAIYAKRSHAPRVLCRS
jgi:hypothetical protein